MTNTNSTTSSARRPTKSQRPVKWIPAKDLDVAWIESQRPLNKSKVAAIQNDIDPDALGVICVAPLGDKGGRKTYHIIDGQHRVAAVKGAWGEHQQVPCQVIEEAKTPQEAAEIWLVVNNERSKPNSFERFEVALTAGRELETAVNLIINASPFHLGKGGVTAVNVCSKIYRNQGGETLGWCLEIAHQCWGGEQQSVQAGILDGLALFVKKFRGEGKNFDDKRLVLKVSQRYTGSSLIGSARAARETFGGSIASNVARVMAQAYNKKIRLEENYLVFV